MKLLILLTLVMLNTANASVFAPTTELPVELQNRVVKMIQEQADCVDLNNFREVKTTSEIDWIDQGIWDRMYTTTLKGIYYYDRYHPSHLTLIVKTEEYSISNPNFDRFKVVEFSPKLDSLCEDLF